MIELRFTDGVRIIDLADVHGTVRRYTPQIPELETLTMGRVATDGGEQPVVAFRNVTESAEVWWLGNLAAQRANMATLATLFQQARHWQRTHMGAPVFVELRANAGEPWYRSEVLSGRALIDDSRTGLGAQLDTPMLTSEVIFTRRFFWEYAATPDGDDAPLELPLNGTTGGTAITCDASNTLDVTAGDVLGDLPAPLRLKITNTYDNTIRHYTLYLAHNVFSDPTGLNHHLAGGTTAQVGTSETLLYTWNLTAATLAALGGNVCRLMMLLSSVWPNTLWMRFKVYYSVTNLWEGQWTQQTGQGMKDMGTVRLPGRVVTGTDGPQPLELRLYGRDVDNPGATYNVTWLQTLPLDSYRVLTPAGYGLPYTYSVVDDAIEGEIWADWGDGYLTHYSTSGEPISVWPGRDQRVYLLIQTDTGTAIDGRASTVQAYYRPRRLAL